MPESVQYRLFAGILLLVSSIGCRFTGVTNVGFVAAPICVAENSSANLAIAESAYAQGVKLESICDTTCVDYYFQAATLAWPEVGQQIDEQGIPCGQAASIYNASLSKLVSAGQRLGRLDPRFGLVIRTSTGSCIVPAHYHGFPWQPGEIDHLIPIDQYSMGDLNNKYRYRGYGVSTIAFHYNTTNEPFRKSQQIFSATVLLRPHPDFGNKSDGAFVLELFDPSRISSITKDGVQVPLERDLTAPIAWRINNTKRDYLEGFLQPGSTSVNDGLFMIEPYQPGKIPIVFIHGLLSDPLAWANMANEIRACPEFVEKYQLWAFEYATGEPFLKSAAKLRRQLQEARVLLDPTLSDTALSQMVLVGHSMGGLVSNLQITHSGNQLWEAVACCPFDSIVTTPETRLALAESFYFEPSPFVSCVVFIGTPHRGSPWANRPIGQLGAKLVEQTSSLEEMHQQLINDNPGVFSAEFTRRVPTSIDLLKPESPLLLSIDRLPIDMGIRRHSIIGHGYWMPGSGDSDSVVPVSSAQESGVVSETCVHEKHESLPQHAESIAGLMDILKRHLSEHAASLPNMRK